MFVLRPCLRSLLHVCMCAVDSDSWSYSGTSSLFLSCMGKNWCNLDLDGFRQQPLDGKIWCNLDLEGFKQQQLDTVTNRACNFCENKNFWGGNYKHERLIGIRNHRPEPLEWHNRIAVRKPYNRSNYTIVAGFICSERETFPTFTSVYKKQ